MKETQRKIKEQNSRRQKMIVIVFKLLKIIVDRKAGRVQHLAILFSNIFKISKLFHLKITNHQD